MKKLYCILLFLILALVAHPQISTNNYILTRTMRDSLGIAVIERIQYYDDLSRPYLTILKGAADGVRHLASLQEYDAQGRTKYVWLPVCIEQEYNFSYELKKKLLEVYRDSSAYTSYDYYTLPLNRVTSESGPGKAWAGRGVKNDYFFNTVSPESAFSCKKYLVRDGGGGLVYDGYYKANSLSVVRTTDEDGCRSYTFKDVEGHVLLVRLQDGDVFFDTYSVYDSFGRLCYVLPPSYQENEDLNLWAYQYFYDGLGRCIRKKYPGCDEVSYVYDKADRIICSEDGVQRSCSRYTYYTYDAFGRLTSKSERTRDSGGGSDLVNSFLQKYYDNYDFLDTPELSAIKDSLSYCMCPGFGVRYINADVPSASSCNMLTGTSVDADIFGESRQTLYTVFYYDCHGNVIQQCSMNHLGGFDRDFYSYTFMGKISSHRHVHTAPDKATRTYTKTYSYDFLDRLVCVTHQQDSMPGVTLFENAYDSLGRLSSRIYHGLSSIPITYSYNIRGWLTSIRHPLFSQTLYYTDGPGKACYNGNISSMTWHSGTETTTRGYKFIYDRLFRLKDALYGEGNTLNLNTYCFNEQVTAYDKMGNILGLKRYGQTSANAYDLTDNLSLSYTGNQLKKVTDTASAFNNGFEFTDGADEVMEYEYDKNGNLTKDLNKKITEIQYNYLNLPTSILFDNGDTLLNMYDSNGVKYRASYKVGSVTTIIDYCGNVIYENGVPIKLLTDVGYITLNDNKYHYFIQDHQGNNRVVVDQEGTIEEVNHYYPFGGTFANPTSVQPYKYNGKELNTRNNLNWYDYGARHYDAALGRWHVVDPMAEKYYSISPYTYCLNNPIKFIDPTGMVIEVPPGFWASFGKGFSQPFVNFGNAVSHPVETVTGIVNTVKNATPLEVVFGFGEQLLRSPISPVSSAFSQLDVVQAMAYDKANGTMTSAEVIGSQWGNAAFDAATIAVGAGVGKVTGTLGKASLGAGKVKGLGNPFKNMTLDQVRTSMNKHVGTGKLKVVVIDNKTGLNKTYYNNNSGYSYNLDRGRLTRIGRQQVVEGPHIDVNYPNPKPKNIQKKKLPVNN